MRYQRRLIFLYHRPSLITKRRNSSKGSSTLSHFHCYNFRGTDEVSEKVDIPLPQAKSDNKEEEQFKRFFYSVSGEVILQQVCFIMPPTSKKLRGHIGLGLSVQCSE